MQPRSTNILGRTPIIQHYPTATISTGPAFIPINEKLVNIIEGLIESMAEQGKIDVHSHFLPPFYRKACLETDHGEPDGMPAIPVCSSLKSAEL